MDSGLYEVVGRLMDGQYAVGYRLRKSDGEIKTLRRSDVIKLALDERIINMRVQKGSQDVILRGVGVNLNELPVYREDKDKDKDKCVLEYKIIQRVYNGKTLIGYVVIDNNNKKLNFSVIDTMELIKRGSINNASIENVDSRPMIKINEKDGDIDILQLDKSSSGVGNKRETIKVMRVNHGGAIYNTELRKETVFSPGDFIVISNAGVIKKMSGYEMQKYEKCSENDFNIAYANMDKYIIKITIGDVRKEISIDENKIKKLTTLKLKT